MNELSIQSNVEQEVFGAPGYRLFSAKQVGAVTLFGGIFAGGLLISYNYAKLGKPDEALRTAALSFAAFVLLWAASFVVFSEMPESQVRGLATPLSVATAFAMAYAAKQLQGESLDEHLTRGGKGIPALAVAAVCAFALVFIFGVMVLFGLALESGS